MVNQRVLNNNDNIYRITSEYIECLQVSSILEMDQKKKKMIEKEIKKLKRSQSKYFVPSLSIFNGRKINLTRKNRNLRYSLEKSRYSLVKKLNRK